MVSAVGTADPATGGTVAVTNPGSPAYGASLVVPPGAVSEAARITISVASDADHVLDPPQAIDNLRQAIDSCTVAAGEALDAGNASLADALKADSATLARTARRLAAVLVGRKAL